ncbi:MAG TPA: polyamine aminopropyltransferase [Nitrospirales bacterium]|nr:polyamine aminopropyltransferase [Nitrospirales bacterium]
MPPSAWLPFHSSASQRTRFYCPARAWLLNWSSKNAQTSAQPISSCSPILAHPSSSAGVSNLLKICLFATGFAGIVAEFVLCTLATYLIGNAVLQWTLIISFMLFAMGLGSRLSRHFTTHLLETFIILEFILSILCATSAVVAYALAPWVRTIELVIYPWAIGIGLLIGLEIPLITRINATYEELRTNISAVMEKDYYGALFGGLFFALIALPFLGLTYTPIIVGTINAAAASLLLVRCYPKLATPRRLSAGWAATGILLIGLLVTANPIILYGEKSKYRDTVIFSQQTQYQKIVMTRWKDEYALFINGNQQFSTYDEERYHEPLVHLALSLLDHREDILIIGGGDGLAVREVLKYTDVKRVTLIDLDPTMTELGSTHPVIVRINHDALNNARVTILNQDGAAYLRDINQRFDAIIMDLPDPQSVDLARMYSLEFYRLAGKHLNKGGTIVTQATSPFFAPMAFLSIKKTMEEAGFSVLPYHINVPTLGDWGFVLGIEPEVMADAALKQAVLALHFDSIETRFLNREAVVAMVHFGKGLFERDHDVEVNRQSRPVFPAYYNKGRWEAY